MSERIPPVLLPIIQGWGIDRSYSEIIDRRYALNRGWGKMLRLGVSSRRLAVFGIPEGKEME